MTATHGRGLDRLATDSADTADRAVEIAAEYESGQELASAWDASEI